MQHTCGGTARLATTYTTRGDGPNSPEDALLKITCDGCPHNASTNCEATGIEAASVILWEAWASCED
jgi:hypothetical protein